MCVWGVGGGGREGGGETLASYPGSFLLKEKMSLGTRLGRDPQESEEGGGGRKTPREWRVEEGKLWEVFYHIMASNILSNVPEKL